MPKAERRDQRRAAALFNVVALKRSGRNNALNYCAWALRELVEKGAIEASGACKLRPARRTAISPRMAKKQFEQQS